MSGFLTQDERCCSWDVGKFPVISSLEMHTSSQVVHREEARAHPTLGKQSKADQQQLRFQKTYGAALSTEIAP